MRIILSTILLLTFNFTIAQNYWSESKNSENSRNELLIKTRNSKVFDLDHDSFKDNFHSKNIIKAPLPDGTFASFILTEARTMSPELKAKYPDIKVFNGESPDGRYTGNFDFTTKGFHGMIKSNDGLIYIDPTDTKNASYQVYYKSDFINTKASTLNDDILLNKGSKVTLSQETQKTTASRSSGTELRTYRTAITCTGEYAAFHGGTVNDALSAIVTTINRVNGIYEREVGITLELIGDTDLLLYTNSSTDPYTNSDASAYIDEVQANIDAIIGDSNYDIGHGFSTGAGGLAGPGPCITGRKATGVTGTSSPVGDPYDVDYVAHEVGHQFGANHTFNGSTGSCSGGNRNASTAYEPGSGTTILAYAGICAPQNIQSNSDAFMHTASFDEILSYSVDGSGNSCPTITSTGNNPPVVDAGNGGYIIPMNTPFSLTGSASDPDGHSLTYSWEQFDLGPAGAPNSATGNAPIFRSFPPSESPTRNFPQISDILNDTQTMGEILPSYGRTLTFRLTARDNQNGGGGVSYDETSIEVSASAGPFVVNSYNTSDTVYSNTNTLIEWDVANTNISPINCTKVNILLSTDGGFNFDYTLKSNTSNDGSEEILIPDVLSNNARIKIEAVDNIFFDINNSDIVIAEPVEPGFNLSLSKEYFVLCSTNEEIIDINIGSILSFDSEVVLTLSSIQDGLSAELGNNVILPGNSTTFTISNPNLTANGLYDIVITASDGSKSISSSLTINVYDGVVKDINILSPLNLETDISLSPTIIWEKLTGENNYEIDIASDASFLNILQSQNNITKGSLEVTGLTENTTYFLRIKGSNSCVESNYTIHEFTTASITCTSNTSADTPISISGSGANTNTSLIDFVGDGYVESINITDLIGTHTYISDLTLKLKSPSGTEIVLFEGICGDNDDFNLNLDDSSVESTISCPPTDGGTYQPSESLNSFRGELAAGTWTLTIIDGFDGDGGQLTTWTLNICTVLGNKPSPPSNLEATSSNNSNVDLIWDDNSSNESGFEIERSEGNNTSFTLLQSVAANTNSYVDTNISTSSTYFYRVRATADQNSNYSNESSVTFKPFAPVNFGTTEITSSSISLTWNDNNSDEDNYVLERSTITSAYETVATLDANSTDYIDENLEADTKYIYRLKAVRSGISSDYSNELLVTTLPLPPNAPTNLTISANSINELVISWTDNSDNEDYFIIERSLGDNSNYVEFTFTEIDIIDYIDKDVFEFTDYFYRVLARNQGGDSEYSNEVNLSTLVLSTKEELKSNILFPNPFNDKFTIVSDEPLNKTDIWVYNSIGEKIQFVSEFSNNGLIIDLSAYPNGIYYVNQNLKGVNKIYKVLKMSDK